LFGAVSIVSIQHRFDAAAVFSFVTDRGAMGIK
jgi:hypothetical protein